MDFPNLPEFFYEIFDPSLPRLGPGDDEATSRALKAALSGLRRREADRGQGAGPAPAAGPKLRVLDIGCGNGRPTLVLASSLDAAITAVDNHRAFLEELRRRADARGLAGKIEVVLRDMRDLGFPAGSFDLVWSEGALSLMGLGAGLAACREFLAPGGALAFTELAWFKPDPPDECREFFARAYPDMAAEDANLALVGECGFEVLDHFRLPESAWLDGYLGPLEKRLDVLEPESAGDPERAGLIRSGRTEIDIYRKYAAWYGYVFYVARRP